MTAKQQILTHILRYLYQQAPDDKTSLSDLRDELGVSSRDTVASALDQLEAKSYIKRSGVDRLATLCWITADGRQMVRDILERETTVESSTTASTPVTPKADMLCADSAGSPLFSWRLDGLDSRYVSIVQRQVVVEQVTRTLEGPSGKRIAFLYGQPQVGKTFVLERLGEALRDRYIPVFIHVNGWASTRSQSDFLYELAEYIRCDIESSGARYHTEPFKRVPDTNATAEFHNFIHGIIAEGGKPLLLMFDELEYLAREEVDARIFRYLAGLVEGFPQVGFVFAGSVHVLDVVQSSPLVELWKRGCSVHVDCFDKETTRNLAIALVVPYFALEPKALDRIVYLADGHPSLLYKVLEVIVCHWRNEVPMNDVITADDMNVIFDDICVELSPTLQDIWHRLPPPERRILHQVAETKKQSFSLDDVVVGQRYYFEKGLHNLVQRQILDYDVQGKYYTVRLGLLVDAISHGFLQSGESRQ